MSEPGSPAGRSEAESGSSGEERANQDGIDLEKLADKVYDLMRSDARLDRARGRHLNRLRHEDRRKPGWG